MTWTIGESRYRGPVVFLDHVLELLLGQRVTVYNDGVRRFRRMKRIDIVRCWIGRGDDA